MIILSLYHQSVGILIFAFILFCSSESSEKSAYSFPLVSHQRYSFDRGNEETRLLVSSANLSPSVLTALNDFYNSTGGDWWDYVNVSSVSEVWNWTQPHPNPCSQKWQGIASYTLFVSLFLLFSLLFSSFFCLWLSSFCWFPLFSLFLK
jgi:hypothetical protein